MIYLDPKADLTFKRVFGEHPDLVMSFINAMLPLGDDEQVVSIEYLPTELVPENPVKKNSIVDVRCRDGKGRQFIVEMQMVWTKEFRNRVLFNASKAYVSQLDSSEDYKLLQPVYAISLINDIFEKDIPEFYHSYSIVHDKYMDKVIDGLHLVFIELPKFNPHTYSEKKMQVLWLRFLTEINERTLEIPQELSDNAYIGKALETLKMSAYNDAQRAGYDKFWDIVRTEKTLYSSAMERGFEKGMEKGMEKGKKEAERIIAKRMKDAGVGYDIISSATGLAVDEIGEL